jgi:hypothetical protein
VAAAGQAVKGTAKAALEDLAMASTGQGGSKVAQQIMAPGTAFAVRPKGGVYLGAKSVDEPVLTDFDLRIKEIVDNLDKSDPQQKEVASFFDKKVRNYIMNQQGTVDDPIFKKMMTGEIPNFTYASQEVVDAARAGDKAALAEVRNAYDASLSINALVGRKQLKESGKTQHQLEKMLKQKIQEQSPDDYITALMASVYKFEPEDIKKYPALYGSPGFKQFAEESESGALLRMMNKSDLPPHIRRAIAEGEPIFASNRGGIGGDRAVDAQELQDYLLTRNPNDIKNMGFADAVVQSKQWHARLEAARRDPSKFSPKQLYEGTKDVLPVADSMKWVDLRTPDALSLEGNIMGHCVGGSGYCSGVAKDTTKILSLRDKKGIPHVTIELRKGMDNKFNTINQIKGVGNKPAEKYFPQIEEFLNDYSAKLGDNLYITEGKSYLPPNWRNK